MSSMPTQTLPEIVIITPVYNAATVLPAFFAGLDQTTYPKSKISLIMPDGGSTDQTRKLAIAYGAKVIENRLKTGEAGKAAGLRYLLAAHQTDRERLLVCMLDSDNIITDRDWFGRMVEPFLTDSEIIGAEPWQYTYRQSDGYITRYTAMIGMSDPLTMFLGNYDRLNLLTGRWTDLPIKTVDHGRYLDWSVDPKLMPTVGANGSLFRASFFAAVKLGDYLFDIDVLYAYTLTRPARFAKVKIGIVHIFCRDVADFIRKQERRIKDFHYFHAKGMRHYPWKTINRAGIYYFVFSCVTVVPLLWQTLRGLAKKPDLAWFFHPVACWLTLWVYGTNAILSRFMKPALADRSKWVQR